MNSILKLAALVLLAGLGATQASSARAEEAEMAHVVTYKQVHAFGSQRSDGAGPPSTLLRVGKMLYGVTPEGGARNEGTIYRVSMSGTGYQRLHSFSSLSGAPHGPHSSLAQGADGFLYGTTNNGGADDGTVYKLTVVN